MSTQQHTNNKLTLTLVIPVYNEEHHIQACLTAVMNQTVLPDEIIVVDNNCTDRTIALATSFAGVTIVREPKQGRGHAREAGFVAARGDIIGRIDADSRMDPHWVERVKRRFEADPNLDGLTGIGRTSFLPYLNWPKSTLPSRSYYWFAHAGFGTITMWGATMAVRRTAWQAVSQDVCTNDRVVHEDQDISLLMAGVGSRIEVDTSVLITTNGQTYRYLPKLLHYSRLYESTKARHRRLGTMKRSAARRLGFWQTLPGRIGAVFVAFFITFFAIICFPIDVFIVRVLRRPQWLD